MTDIKATPAGVADSIARIQAAAGQLNSKIPALVNGIADGFKTLNESVNFTELNRSGSVFSEMADIDPSIALDIADNERIFKTAVAHIKEAQLCCDESGALGIYLVADGSRSGSVRAFITPEDFRALGRLHQPRMIEVLDALIKQVAERVEARLATWNETEAKVTTVTPHA